MLATGRIRNYQLVVGGLQMMNFPISYILLRIGLFPEIVFIVAIVISQCCLGARLLMLRGMIGLSVRKYFKKVYLNIVTVTVIASIIPVFLIGKMQETFLCFVLHSFIAVICSLISIYYVGCNTTERIFIRNKITAFVKGKRK